MPPCFPDGCRHCELLDENFPASSRKTTQQPTPFWNVAVLQPVQKLDDSAIAPVTKWLRNSNERPPKLDVAPYNDATKLYWVQWESLHLRDGQVYRLWETLAGDSSACMATTTAKEAEGRSTAPAARHSYIWACGHF